MDSHEEPFPGFLSIVRRYPVDNPQEKGEGRYFVIADTEFLCHFGTVLTDKLLRLDTVILQELAHGIEVVHRHHVVLRVVVEHHVEIAARSPSAGERILTEDGLEPARQGTVLVDDGIRDDVARLLGLDEFLVEGPALVLLAEEPLVEVLGHGVFQIVVDVVPQTEAKRLSISFSSFK